MAVDARAVPKGRPRTVTRRGKSITYTPGDTRAWEELIGWEYRRQVGAAKFAADDRLLLVCRFVSPPSMADGDNLFKGVADGLQGVAFSNDRQIRTGAFEMVDGDEPRTEIRCYDATQAYVRICAEPGG